MIYAVRRRAAGIDVTISNHAVVRSLQVMGTCGEAQRDRFLLDK